MGRRAEAETWLENGVNILAPLVRDESARAEAVSTWSETASALAEHYNTTSRPKKALELIKQVIAANQQLATANPNAPRFRHRVAMSRQILAQSLKDERHADEAEAELTTAVADLEQLASQFADNVEYRDNVTSALNSLGLLLVSVSRWSEAEELFQKARSLMQQLLDGSPDSPEYQFGLANIVNNLGIVYRNTSRRDEAAKAYADAVEVKERLARNYPNRRSYTLDLGGSLCNCGNVARDAGRPEQSLEWYDRAEAELTKVLAQEPRHATALRFLQNTLVGRAHGLTQLARYDEALREVDRGLKLGSDKGTASFRMLRARILAHLGDHRAAVAASNDASKPEFGSVSKVEHARVYALSHAASTNDHSTPESDRVALADKYRAQAIDLLTQATRREKVVPDQLKHEDFKSLRAFPEFRSIVSRLGAPSRSEPDQ
jgi:tetratricopeptide (TPR) repeat protein